MNTITVAQLRRTLTDYFEPPTVDTALRVPRQCGTIPEGQSGFAGCRSAPISIKQALLVALALASGAHPKHGPHEAARIGAFRLLRRDQTHIGYESKRTPFENQQIDLLTVMAGEIERCDDDHLPSSWDISSHGACQAAPDRLVFGPSLAALTDPADVVVRSCRIPGRLLADIAELFHIERVEAAD
jgi:hypothetical protein